MEVKLEIKMKKTLIWILSFIVLSSFAYAYYPNQTVSIPALFTVNDAPSSVSANITITKPNSTIDVNNQPMTEYETGKFNYSYTFPEEDGAYKVEVNFYNSTADLQGTVYDIYQAEYNHTDELAEINYTVTQNNGILNNIWDWVQSTLLGVKEYSTDIIGKTVPYETIIFRTELNFIPSSCGIYINTLLYNMTVYNKVAIKKYYIPNGGLYEWNVTCT